MITLELPEERRLGLLHDDTLLDPCEPRRGQPVRVSLWARAGTFSAAAIRCAPDGEEELHAMRVVRTVGDHALWQGTLTPRVPRLRYRFVLERAEGVVHLHMAGTSDIDPLDVFDFTLLCHDAAHSAPPRWPLDAVLYQIFPDRFAQGDPSLQVRDGQWQLRGRPSLRRRFGDAPLPYREGGNLDFYGGDLPGITSHLDHLERLGVSGLFLNPVWPAPSNHRYDLLDHGRVDEHLGGDGALADLATALRARGMRLVLDVVLNHTGSAHPWFNREGYFPVGGAGRDRDAPERDWYLFADWPRYHGWMGHDTLPRLDLRSPSLRAHLVGCLQKFLAPPYSIDGYRFDVANMMFRDGQTQQHRPMWSELSSLLRIADRDVWLLGEHFFDPDKLLKGDGLDGVMAYQGFTFPTRTWLARSDRRGRPARLDAAGLVAQWRQGWARMGYTHARRSSLHVNTHDIARLQSVVGEGLGGRALDVATALQLSLPGVPCLYYGDEVGLEGGADPDNRRCMPWDESTWNRARLDETRRLVALRRATPALARGGFCDLGSTGDVVAYARPLEGRATLVVASRSDEARTVKLAVDVPGLPRRERTVELAPMSADLSEL